MAKTISELKAQSAEVKNASAIGENTATRVGQLFGDIVEHVEHYETNKDGKDASQDAQMQSLVSAEASRAKGEERGLQNQIHAEEIDRKTADTYLGNLIQQESSARETADENIKTALANETARAQAAEQELAAAQIYTAKIKDGAVTTPKIADGAVTYEKTDIIAQELGTNITKVPSQKVVTDAVKKEETERKADVNGLAAALASETINREQGDENLNAAIEAEAEARDNAINNEAQARSKNDALLNQAIVAEKDRAEAREQELTVAIQQETERAEAREQELTVAIQQETERAEAREQELNKIKEDGSGDFVVSDNNGNVHTRFSSEGLETKNIILTDENGNKTTLNENLNAAIQQETERAEAREQELTVAIQQETERAEAREQELTVAIQQETERAEAREQELTVAIQQETERAEAREQELTVAIQQETERAEAREQELTVAIQQETERAEAREQELTVAIQQETERAEAREQELNKIKEDGSGDFVVSDNNGNVHTRFSSEGLETKNIILTDENGNKTTLNGQSDFNKIKEDGSGDFVVSDNNGNVHTRFSSEGLETKNIIANNRNVSFAYIHPLAQKNVFFFGDSHTTSNAMYEEFMRVSRCKIDIGKNQSINLHLKTPENPKYKKYEFDPDILHKCLYCLYDTGYDVDCIFLENTHYIFNDDISAIPFIGTQLIELNTEDNAYNSLQAMENDKDLGIKEIISRIADDKKMVCTVGKLYYKSITANLQFSVTDTIQESVISLTVNGQSFNVYTYNTDTLQDVLTRLNQWQLSEFGVQWINKNHHSTITGDTLTLSFIGENADVSDITFNAGNSHISLVSKTKSEDLQNTYILFMSRDISEWENPDKWIFWKDKNGYSFLKGTFELAQRLFPKASICAWYPVSLDISNANPPKYFADGSFDIVSFENTSYHYQECIQGANTWKRVAEIYNIRFIDLRANCGMSAINKDHWYNGGIHTTAEGYGRWGQILAELY